MITMRPERSLLRYTGACSAVLLLGVAMALAQNQGKQGDQNATNNNATKTAGARAKADADAKGQATRRGHALGMTVEAGDQGVVVSKVEQGGVAGKAGLREKDRIVSADHRSFKNPRQLEAYLSSHGGRPIPVVVMRDGKQQTIMYMPPHRSGDSAWLGVFLEEGENAAKGAEINQVYPDGPAARAGLQPGDIIAQVGNEKIENAADLIATVAGMAPQTEIQFVILRGDQKETIPVTLGSHQQFGPMPNGNQQGEGEQAQAQGGHGHAFDTIPPHAMRLEHDRRNAEQHQRIEEEIRQLREEIRQLREELKQSRK
jgi:predicted metalloprotease with PDZ domain